MNDRLTCVTPQGAQAIDPCNNPSFPCVRRDHLFSQRLMSKFDKDSATSLVSKPESHRVPPPIEALPVDMRGVIRFGYFVASNYGLAGF